MEKDSSKKSNTKKKTDSEKAEKKKTTKPRATAKKTAAGSKKAPAKKSAAKKTAAQKKKPASTTKRTAKKTTAAARTPKQKAAATKKKKVSMKDLLSRKFDSWTPEKPYRPPVDTGRAKTMEAPPYLTGENAAEIEQKRKLLFKTFDLKKTSPEEPEHQTGVTTPPDSQFPPPDQPPVMTKRSDPMGMAIKFGVVAFILLVAIIVRVSALNQSRYYLKPTTSGVEILQGIFAPMGEERIILLAGAEKPDTIQAVYSKQEVYPFIFNYYVKKADELLEKPGMPDFEGIKTNLAKALPYASTEKLRTIAEARRNNIDKMILIYKAEVAVSKETLPDYEAALEYLKEAQTLDVDGSSSGLIQQKTESITASLLKLKEAEEKAAEETPTEN